MSKTKKIIMFGAILFISGCDDTNQIDNDSEIEQARISAQNAIYSTVYSDSYEVDLSNNVTFSGSDGFSVSNVEALSTSPECQVQSMTQTGFTISVSSSKACDYEYEVVLGNNTQVNQPDNSDSVVRMTEPLSDSAITRVAISQNASAEGSVELSTISSTTFIEQNVEVDVKQELQLQTGYILSPEFTLNTDLTLPYSSATATADPINNIISYTPPAGFEGIERILFSYIDDLTGDVLLGTLDIAVTNTANQGLEVQENIIHDEVEVNQLITIDVSPYVTSLDGDDYQLVYVDSFNADTKPLNENDLYNKEFTFLTNNPRLHYVSFAVSDHKGAYAIGLIEIRAYDLSTRGSWEGISYESKWYSRPLTASSATENGLLYSTSITDTTYSPSVDIALFSYIQAQNGCAKYGNLPSADEMTVLYNQNVKLNYNWPVTVPYWVDDNGTGKVIDMVTGEVSEAIAEENYIVTCIANGFTVEGPEKPILANNIEQASVIFTYKVGGSEHVWTPTPDESIEYTVDSTTAELDRSNGITNADGEALVRVTNTKSETVEVCGDVRGEKSCTNVTFIGDIATAKIASSESDVSDWVSGEAESVVHSYVKIEDIYGNPVQDVIVEANKLFDENSDSLTILNTSAVSDQYGIATFNMTNNESAMTDFVMIEFMSSPLVSILNEDLLFGTWQWSKPLKMMVYPYRDIGANFSCSAEFGSHYRGLTISEVTEWVNAYESGAIKLDNNWRKDPILAQLEYFLEEGGEFYADDRNSMSFWVGDINSLGGDTPWSNAIRYNSMNYNEIGTVWGNKASGDLKNITGWDFESAPIAESVLGWQVKDPGRVVNYTQLCVANYSDLLY